MNMDQAREYMRVTLARKALRDADEKATRQLLDLERKVLAGMQADGIRLIRLAPREGAKEMTLSLAAELRASALMVDGHGDPALGSAWLIANGEAELVKPTFNAQSVSARLRELVEQDAEATGGDGRIPAGFEEAFTVHRATRVRVRK